MVQYCSSSGLVGSRPSRTWENSRNYNIKSMITLSNRGVLELYKQTLQGVGPGVQISSSLESGAGISLGLESDGIHSSSNSSENSVTLIALDNITRLTSSLSKLQLG